MNAGAGPAFWCWLVGFYLAFMPPYAYWTAKRSQQANPAQKVSAREYEPIKMPRNSAIGFVNALFAVLTGFALIWHMSWMAALGAFATFLLFAFRGEDEIEIPAERIPQFERRPY